eukprot:536616_1
MSSSRKRKGDHISPTANKRRKITNSISTNNNNNNNIDNNNNNNVEIDQINSNSKPQIKRPPRNIRIKVTQNGFVIVPKPMRNNTKTFILEVVSKTEKDENNKAINGTAKTRRLAVSEAIKEHLDWHDNIKLWDYKNMTIQNIKGMNKPNKHDAIETYKDDINGYIQCIKKNVKKIKKRIQSEKEKEKKRKQKKKHKKK